MTTKINAETLALVNGWLTTDPKTELVIGIDIGATNTRVAVSRAHSSDAVSSYHILATFETDDADLLYPRLAEIAAALPVPVRSACIDAAGPILDGGKRVIITNWSETKNRELCIDRIDERICPHNRTSLLNDLEAACYGVTALGSSKQLGDYFVNFEHEDIKPESLPLTRHLVLAMGTGLGVGILLNMGDKFVVVPAEIGHTLVTQFGKNYPDAADDAEFIAWLGKRVWNNDHLAEFEDICSGRGLSASYEWTSRNDPNKHVSITPKEIAELAKKGDKSALDAMYLHYKFLFRVAQNCCVGLQTKGVIMAGDNQVYNHWFVESVKEKLMREFKWHPKENPKDKWLEGIPILVQTKSVNTNMIGCVCKAKEIA